MWTVWDETKVPWREVGGRTEPIRTFLRSIDNCGRVGRKRRALFVGCSCPARTDATDGGGLSQDGMHTTTGQLPNPLRFAVIHVHKHVGSHLQCQSPFHVRQVPVLTLADRPAWNVEWITYATINPPCRAFAGRENTASSVTPVFATRFRCNGPPPSFSESLYLVLQLRPPGQQCLRICDFQCTPLHIVPGPPVPYASSQVLYGGPSGVQPAARCRILVRLASSNGYTFIHVQPTHRQRPLCELGIPACGEMLRRLFSQCIVRPACRSKQLG